MTDKQPTNRLESMRTAGQPDPRKMDPRNRSSEFWNEADRNYVQMLAEQEAARIADKARKQTTGKGNEDEYNRLLMAELQKRQPQSTPLFQPGNLDWSHEHKENDTHG